MQATQKLDMCPKYTNAPTLWTLALPQGMTQGQLKHRTEGLGK